jgi:hypothetical protein
MPERRSCLSSGTSSGTGFITSPVGVWIGLQEDQPRVPQALGCLAPFERLSGIAPLCIDRCVLVRVGTPSAATSEADIRAFWQAVARLSLSCVAVAT